MSKGLDLEKKLVKSCQGEEAAGAKTLSRRTLRVWGQKGCWELQGSGGDLVAGVRRTCGDAL